MIKKFKVNGLDCANCAAELERVIAKIEGISSANINFMTQRMELDIDKNNYKDIMKKVKKAIKKEEPDVILEEM